MQTRRFVHYAMALAVLFLGDKCFASCSVPITLSPPGTFPSFAATGGSSSVTVNTGGIAGTSCHWSIATAPWVHASPTSGGGGSQFQFTVNFSVDANGDLGARSGLITATQTEDGTRSSDTVPQNAATGGFILSPNPTSQTIAPTTGTSYGITILRSGQFTGCVSMSPGTLPSGVTANFSPVNVCGTTTTMTVTANGNACPGTDTIVIQGSNSGSIATTPVGLNVIGDFSLAVSSSSQSVMQGSSSSAVVTITPSSGLTAPVALTAPGLPSGVTASFSPNNISSGSSTMTVTATTGTALGSTAFNVQGSTGCLTHSVGDTLSVGPIWWPAIQKILKDQ